MATFELLDDGPSLPRMEVRRDPNKDLIANLQAELDAFHQVMQMLSQMDPAMVFQTLSSFSARASEMRSIVIRQDTNRLKSFRTGQIEPFLEECDRQFRILSRLQSVRDLEYRLSKGEF